MIIYLLANIPNISFRSGNKSDSDEEDPEAKKFKNQLGGKISVYNIFLLIFPKKVTKILTQYG